MKSEVESEDGSEGGSEIGSEGGSEVEAGRNRRASIPFHHLSMAVSIDAKPPWSQGSKVFSFQFSVFSFQFSVFSFLISNF